ncbi:MAG: HlyD family efflux transporter periplasmic adaptor subunit [Saprospiraceae bacterium]|nr:HlyD family efflux transporter periplasmic adaptor subunit [Saprospiraceae bacterium]
MKTHLSEEILDIINESPRWVVRMGATVIMLLLLMILAGTWYIRYPEVLKGAVVVTTTAPTIKVVAEKEGRIMRLLVHNGANVRRGDVLAEMENRTKLENTPLLEALLLESQAFLKNPRRAITLPESNLTWGDLQTDVNLLVQNYVDLKQLQSDGFHARQVQNLKEQTKALRQLQQVLSTKKELSTEALSNTFASYNADKQLFEEGVYSRAEFMKKENDYLAKKREQEDHSENLINNALKLAELEETMQRLDHDFLEKQRLALANINQAVHNIGNGLRNWQQQYLITAPSDGKIAFLQNLTENQFVKSGETLFTVRPSKQDLVAMVDIPVKGMGKAGVGQKVVLKLDDYPFQEFGTVEGIVESLAPSSDVKSYRMVVSLPNGLKSSYNRTFSCKSEMSGTAEVITEDMRLFERAFYGIRKMVM